MRIETQYYRDLLITALSFAAIAWLASDLWWVAPGLIVAAMGMIFFAVRKANHSFWFGITKLMGLVFQPLIFGIIFFVILFPLGLLFRVFRKNPLQEESSFTQAETTSQEGFFDSPW